MNNYIKQYGIVILLDALGTRQRIKKDLDSYITDWELVINKLQTNIQKLNQGLSLRNYKSGIRMKDIFDNIQVFYPIDNPVTTHVDLSGDNSLWWSLQHSADLLINFFQYALTKKIFFRGCISIGHVIEVRETFYSKTLIENADLIDSFNLIGIICGPTALRVLNNKQRYSSPILPNFVKYKIPYKTGKSFKDYPELPIVNIIKQSIMFDNLDDIKIRIDDTINEQVNTNKNDQYILRKWKKTKKYFKFIQKIDDEKFYL
jgi:hypothetical protein